MSHTADMSAVSHSRHLCCVRGNIEAAGGQQPAAAAVLPWRRGGGGGDGGGGYEAGEGGAGGYRSALAAKSLIDLGFKNVYNIGGFDECVINGDNTYKSIAAASILAKVNRDNYINNLCEEYPELKKYDIHNNKGYGTKKHLEAIKEYGITKWHRKTFGICKEYY